MLSCDKELKNCNSSVLSMMVERVSLKEFQIVAWLSKIRLYDL